MSKILKQYVRHNRTGHAIYSEHESGNTTIYIMEILFTIFLNYSYTCVMIAGA